MNVCVIVQEYLKEHGYDGLHSPYDCACEVDDLAPCCGDMEDCEPGYKVPCDCGDGCNFHMVAQKPEQEVPS